MGRKQETEGTWGVGGQTRSGERDTRGRGKNGRTELMGDRKKNKKAT